MASTMANMTTTEASNRLYKAYGVNVQPSYLNMLCQSGDIEHLTVPSPYGRKKDLFLIPESQLESIAKKLSGAHDNSQYTLTVKDIQDLLDYKTSQSVLNLITKGVLHPIVTFKGKQKIYRFKESDIMDYMSNKEKKHDGIKSPSEKIEKVVASSNSNTQADYLRVLDKYNSACKTIDNLKSDKVQLETKIADITRDDRSIISDLQCTITDLKAQVKTLEAQKEFLEADLNDYKIKCQALKIDLLSETSETQKYISASDQWKEGFKEGFKAGREIE